MSREARLISVHVVAGILKREDTFLIAERPVGKPYSGYWEFPGGKLEPHELAEQALKRELHEELGIQVITAQYICDHHYTYPDKTVKLEVWLVNDFVGEPQGQENQIIRWVSLADMSTMPLLEGNWPLLDIIKSFFNTGV